VPDGRALVPRRKDTVVTQTPLWSADIDQHGSTSRVTLHGELDLIAAEPLRRLLLEQLDRPDTEDVVADLAAVTFLDSAALGALIVAYRRAEQLDRHFALTRPARSVRRVLEIGGVYDILVAAGG
jgi:anti-anti-sigma factor